MTEIMVETDPVRLAEIERLKGVITTLADVGGDYRLLARYQLLVLLSAPYLEEHILDHLLKKSGFRL